MMAAVDEYLTLVAVFASELVDVAGEQIVWIAGLMIADSAEGWKVEQTASY